MRVVVIGATGNVGTSVLESLEDEPAVPDVVAVARRPPGRAFARTTFVLRVQPGEPGWLDTAFGVPRLGYTRVRSGLGWDPRHTATDALAELIAAMRRRVDYPTPPLARATIGPAPIRELVTAGGGRSYLPA
jgi:Semialdehyde dehydrogenase, NAD binding domain